MNIFLKFCYQQKLKLWSFICSGLQSLEPGIKWDVIKRILLNHLFHCSIWRQHTVRRNEKIVSSWAFWAYLKSRRNSQEFLEFATEFPSKSAVYKKVDRRVEGYQKVRNLKEKFGTTTFQFNIYYFINGTNINLRFLYMQWKSQHTVHRSVMPEGEKHWGCPICPPRLE